MKTSSTVGSVDLVIFCVKTYDTEEAMRAVIPLVGDATTILTLQNGIDNRERIAKMVGDRRALAGAAYISSEVESPGVIRHKGGGKIVTDEADGSQTERIIRINQALVSAGVPSEISGDIQTVLWEKMAWVCAIAGMNCITRLPLGPTMSTEASRGMFGRIMREIITLGNAQGASIPDQYEAQMTAAAADSWDGSTIASMYNDLVQERRLELESLHGMIVRMGHGRHIPAEMNEAVYAALKPNERANRL